MTFFYRDYDCESLTIYYSEAKNNYLYSDLILHQSLQVITDMGKILDVPVLEYYFAGTKGETTDLDHSKLKINHVNSTESLEIVVDHLNSFRVTRTH